MKIVKSIAFQFFKNSVLFTAKKEANSACLCIAYQPKMPESVKNLHNTK